MTRDDIKNLSIIGLEEFPLMVECEKCGTEHSHPTKINFKAIRYELILHNGKKLYFTRDYKESAGEFYDWICNIVLPDIKSDIIKKSGTDHLFGEWPDEIPDDKVTNVIPSAPIRLDKIEREDIVRCIYLKPDEDGKTNELLEVGKEYRVLEVGRGSYELINDTKNDMRRFEVHAVEVELVRKAIKPAKRVQKFETTVTCECGALNAIEKNGNKYVGKCRECGRPLETVLKQEGFK